MEDPALFVAIPSLATDNKPFSDERPVVIVIADQRAMKVTVIWLAAVVAVSARPWMDASLPVDVRTDLLLSAMTLEEKTVQG